MADFTLDKQIGGKPAYLWIGGGVAVAYAAYWFINRNKIQTPTATDQTPGYDYMSMPTGSSGGSGLATYDGTGVPGPTGITAPTAFPPGTVITIPGGPTQPEKPKTPVTKVPVKSPKVTRTPPPATVTQGRAAVTKVHKRGYTNAELYAAKQRKAKEAAEALKKQKGQAA